MNAVLVSVNYTDLLAITLPYNRIHFDRVVVVTSPEDEPNVTPVAQYNWSEVVVTNAFYEDGASFNKWKALEQGLDYLGRKGWICLMDADILWPKRIAAQYQSPLKRLDSGLTPGILYSPLRRMHTDLSSRWTHPCRGHRCDPINYREHYPGSDGPETCACKGTRVLTLPYPPEEEWNQFPVHRNTSEWAGYTQIFHTSDPVLGDPPWHEVNWKHAGGADSFFQAKWGSANKLRLTFEVLHLGEAGVNWYGRSSQFLNGTLPEEWKSRQHQCASLWKTRLSRRSQGLDPFTPEKLGSAASILP